MKDSTSPQLSRKTEVTTRLTKKALAMIIAIEGLIPHRRAVSAPNKPAPPPENPPFHVSEWMRAQQNGESVDPHPPHEEAAPELQAAPSPDPTPIEPAVPAPSNPSRTASLLPRVPIADYVAPDTRHPFSIDKNRFGWRR